MAELLAAATSKVLTDLILELAAESPDIRRECFEFLKGHVSVSEALEERSEGEIVLALWSELAPDLANWMITAAGIMPPRIMWLSFWTRFRRNWI